MISSLVCLGLEEQTGSRAPDSRMFDCRFDYGEKFWVIKYKSFLCGCGSPKCKYNAENIQSALEAYHNKNATDDDSMINGE